ncbi:hypothetical protein [Lysobacter sp. A03]|uniref:hypothetical protein n=1 Tax=Lysobacter sp. A03 TaxID=1199154 RepID=UPI0005B69A84|nr:hypothetical protein [Lysobacter sp. A03]KIQ96870.1 hypothetical protein TI01_1596 [Lysobacter sp. A03]
MTPHGSVLVLSLALATSPLVAATAGDASSPVATLPDGGEFAVGTHRFTAAHVEGGDFVRLADGVAPASVEITGHDGLVIDGGKFTTAQPIDLARGIALGRGKSISLYNKVHPGPADTADAPAKEGFQLYTPEQVREIFASGDAARIAKAFTSADAKGVAPEPLNEASVLAALSAANDVVRAREQTAWQLTAENGDLVVNDGVFDFHSVNGNVIAARQGKLVWNGGGLLSRGGGGETTLQGTTGIELLGGSISSAGAVNGTASPIYYDPRQRLDRDRWTLGKYLAVVTDGDINVGRSGERGPELRVSDGMLQIGRATKPVGADEPGTQHINLRSGAISLDGEHRSTLLALEGGFDIVTVISGGTLNVTSAQSLIDTPTESPSMWNMRTVLEDGTINLDNAQLVGPDSALKGGVVNLTGVSAIYSPTGALTISGGTVNVGAQSFIGAIKGDSKAHSPYPTAQQDLVISGGTLNFRIAAPAATGAPLLVGTHIGGIFAGDNNPAKQGEPTLSIGKGTRITVDASALPGGDYRIANFASVDEGDGTLAIAAALPVRDPVGAVIGELNTEGHLDLKVK